MSTAPIFNFNENDTFELTNDEDILYFRPLTPDTQLILNQVNNTVAFHYNNSRTPGGIFVRLGTIPSEVYHIFITGQTIIGNEIDMWVQNNCPELNLGPMRKLGKSKMVLMPGESLQRYGGSAN